MDGVGTPIIGRPRPLPGHDTPNPAYHPHTLNYEEPVYDLTQLKHQPLRAVVLRRNKSIFVPRESELVQARTSIPKFLDDFAPPLLD